MIKFALLIITAFSYVNGYQNYRLSRDITPLHYSIKIQPDFNHAIFYGEVFMYINVKTVAEKIILHSSTLNISRALINQQEAVIQEQPNEKISVSFKDEAVQPGVATLYFNYTGNIYEKGFAFLKARFETDDEENIVYVYVTDLEPTSARKVFPSFDEPFFKAKFSVRLISPDYSYKAISNMPQISQFPTSMGTAYDFATSVSMSAYLVSFAFSQFPYYEDTLELNGKSWPIRIHSLNASKENNEFAMNCTKRAIKWYSEYTSIDYPLPKLDMIEYERNESAATENWGLITFRKGLLTPNLNLYYKSQIELVIYHEISHFWFGNLVTNDWWNDLWLQEGFAAYMSYKLSAEVHNITQLRNMKDFQYDFYLEIETKNNSKSIVSYLPRQEDILKKFDNLVYDKGAAILLMMEDVIGEETFRLSIQNFLKRNMYNTVTTHDFISVIEELKNNVPIRPFIETYVYQNKFPLLKVENNNGTYVLRQEPCQDPKSSEKLGMRWTIPITYLTDTTEKSSPKLVWFDRDMDMLEISEPEAKWIAFNPKGIGIYKVVPAPSIWKNIQDHFENIDLQTSESIISNAVYLFKHNLISCDVIINIMKSVKNNKRWLHFAEFNSILIKTLYCEHYTNEADLFLSFVQKRYNETHYEKIIGNFFYKLCDGTESKELDGNVPQCAAWIKENLDEIKDNSIKEIKS